jgi:hypothetical protein
MEQLMSRVMSKMPEGEAMAIKFMLAASGAEFARDGFTTHRAR